MISFKQFLKEADYHDWSHEGDNNHLDQKLQKHHKYLPSQREPLERYTKDSGPINDHLWEAHKHKRLPDEDFAHFASEIDHGINENKAPHDFHVYSGVHEDPRTKMNSEGIIHHPAFLSTSLSHRVAIGFAKTTNMKSETIPNPHHAEMQKANPGLTISTHLTHTHLDKHILKIRVPKDHPGAYVENITHNPYEYEHILPRGLNLKHIGTDVIHEGTMTYRSHVHVHHIEIVPHDSYHKE